MPSWAWAVGPQADVDHDRTVEALAEVEEVVHGVGQTGRIRQGGVAAQVVIAERDEHPGQDGLGMNARVAAGDAGHMGAVRTVLLRCLAHKITGRNADSGALAIAAFISSCVSTLPKGTVLSAVGGSVTP